MLRTAKRFAGVVLLAGTINGTMAATWFVDEAATVGANTGGNWPNAFLNLQDALTNANPGDEIWVANGTYYPSVLFPNNSDPRRACFYIQGGIQVFGGFQGADFSQSPPCCGETSRSQRNPEVNETILSGDLLQDKDPNNFAYHVVYFDSGFSGSTRLSGFTIECGNADSPDTDPNVPGWLGSVGGGIFANYLGQAGGGVSLNRLVIRNNRAGDGGGGGLHVRYDPLAPGVTRGANISFENNSALGFGAGGGALLRVGRLELQNCVFWRNRSEFQGGALNLESFAQYSPSALLTNCTFFDNETDGLFGGAIYSDAGLPDPNDPNTALRITNSILWNNLPDQVYPNDPNTLLITYSDIDGGYAGTGNVNVDPRFRDAANGNFRLRYCSDLLDAGRDDLVTGDLTDIDDNVSTTITPWDRKRGVRIDDFDGNGSDNNVEIGAFEECKGDIDGRGDVDLADLTLFLSYYGTQGCVGAACDADIAGGLDGCGNGDVDIDDLSLFLTLYGNTCGLETLDGGGDGFGEDSQTQWIRSASPEVILDWADAGMPWPWGP